MIKNTWITIFDNEVKIKELLSDLVLMPRLKALEWSKITKQTPNLKIGYPGQHLASLITGVEGSRTGARGHDLRDGSEVKSCSRVDQLDSCKDCKQKVLRIEDSCSACGSSNIKRMEDSKWLFSIKSEQELDLLTNKTERIFLTIADYPFFQDGDFSSIRIQAFEIWNNVERHSLFKKIMENYFYKIFLEQIKLDPRKTPAPKNFWPFSYQFYLCNPVKVFSCTIKNANTAPEISIDYFIKPEEDRSSLEAEKMPSILLGQEELRALLKTVESSKLEPLISKGYKYSDLISVAEESKLNKRKLFEILPYLDEEVRKSLPLRDTDKISTSKTAYFRT